MATFDLSGFPIVVTRWEEDIDMGEVVDYFVQLDRVIDRAAAEGVRYVTISSGTTNLSAALRKVVADRANQIPEQRAAYNIASFVVLESALLRGTLTAIKWMSRRMENVFAVASFEEGFRRARAAIAAQAVSKDDTGS